MDPSLNSSWQTMSSILSPIFTSQLFGVAIGAIIGGLSSYLANRRIEKIEGRKLRKQVYSQLIGEKILFVQLYVSYFWMYAQREFCEASCVLSENDKSSHDKQEKKNQMQEEYLRAKKKCEDLALEVAKGSRDFWRIIGLVQTAFPNTNKLNKLIENIKNIENDLQHFEEKLSKKPIEIQNEDQIKIYYKNLYQNEFRLLIEDNLETSIDTLLNYLKEEIYQETPIS
ncbi:MAG: hypothetical protein PHW87_02290 [Methanothrix sp.]|nr:hypothetical protein [Methanothrix sp.]